MRSTEVFLWWKKSNRTEIVCSWEVFFTVIHRKPKFPLLQWKKCKNLSFGVTNKTKVLSIFQMIVALNRLVSTKPHFVLSKSSETNFSQGSSCAQDQNFYEKMRNLHKFVAFVCANYLSYFNYKKKQLYLYLENKLIILVEPAC